MTGHFGCTQDRCLPARVEVPAMSNCPFCGVVTEIPHETQAGCIEALHAEIARMRAVLEQLRSAVVSGPPPEEETEEHRRSA